MKLSLDLPRVPDADRADLLQREGTTSRQLRRDGVIVRMWRLPGQRATVSVWRATDATELHEQLTKLPLISWMAVDVTPLAHHPVESDR